MGWKEGGHIKETYKRTYRSPDYADNIYLGLMHAFWDTATSTVLISARSLLKDVVSQGPQSMSSYLVFVLCIIWGLHKFR